MCCFLDQNNIYWVEGREAGDLENYPGGGGNSYIWPKYSTR